jgi:RNA polymerase sigma-70 factor, ECF subfamily
MSQKMLVPHSRPKLSDHRTDDRRLEELIDEHRGVLLAHVARLTGGDGAWAEDVVQETFVRAWKHVDRMESSYGSVRGWLMRVAHNIVVDTFRTARMRRGEVTLDCTAEPITPDSDDQTLSALVVHDLLKILPKAQRVAIEMTYLHDCTTAQAAEVLDLPVGTVKSRVYYGLKLLRTAATTADATAA